VANKHLMLLLSY